MKGGLFRKLVLLYLLLISVLFFIVNTLGPDYMKKQLIDEKEQELYHETGFIAQRYVEPYYDNRMTVDLLMESLKPVAKHREIRILIVSAWGRVVGDTASASQNEVTINGDFFSETFHREVLLPELSSQKQLVVVVPINYNYSTRGYLCTMYGMDGIMKEVDRRVNELNFYYLIVLALLTIGFCAVYILFVYPAKKLIKVAKAYSEGDFNTKINIRSNDEYQLLFERIGYMGDAMSRFDEYQRKIISNISHDFRSPLTSIKGYTEAIKDGTIPPEQQDKYLDTVLFEVERLTKLTTNLLTLNTFDQKGMILQKTKFDINMVIKNVARSFEGTCKKKQILIQLIFAESEIEVYADRGKIEQVIYNLVDNAIKFSHAEGEIRIFSESKGHKAIVSIQDEGIGIDKRDLAKIWDRFYKTDTSRGKDKKGTGLGLSIVKEIMVAHGENINVISTTGVGTEFILTLPQVEPKNV